MQNRKEILKTVCAALSKILKREISEDEYDVKLSYIGVDSILFTVFLLELEKELEKIDLNAILESNANTINSIVDVII